VVSLEIESTASCYPMLSAGIIRIEKEAARLLRTRIR